jgi:hypothetical protein
MTSRNIAVASALVLAIAILSFVVYNLTAVREPSADEYRVYSSLIRHLANDDLLARKKLAVINQTSKLSLPNYDLLAPYQPPTPFELKITVIDDSSFADFRSFCGHCAKDFVKKNLSIWSLRSVPELSLVGATQSQMVERNIALVSVSRVGFNLWHTRAVLTFEADCSDAEKPLMCMEIGKASLKRENGRWIVEQLFATTH